MSTSLLITFVRHGDTSTVFLDPLAVAAVEVGGGDWTRVVLESGRCYDLRDGAESVARRINDARVPYADARRGQPR